MRTGNAASGVGMTSGSSGTKTEIEPSRTASMSDNIWSTLRLTLSLMGRTDLLALVAAKSMEELSRQFQVEEEVVGVSF